MTQVEIDTMYMWVFGSDQVNVGPKTTSNIHKPFYVLETFVTFKNFSHDYLAMIIHGNIENLVKP